ncbi:MAG: hypothetical protein ACRC0X_06930, partial [Brevinema sp.]
GLSMNSLESDKIFVATKLGIGQIPIGYSSISNPVRNVSDKGKLKAHVIALYTNYLGASINKLTITSTKRTLEQQAEIIVQKIIDRIIFLRIAEARGFEWRKN